MMVAVRAQNFVPLHTGYAIVDVDCSDGLYAVHLQIKREVMGKKFMKP
jgi:hypothetical protein